MSDKTTRSSKQPHKKGANKHDPAVKHEKTAGTKAKSRDIHEDRGVRKKKLAGTRR